MLFQVAGNQATKTSVLINLSRSPLYDLGRYTVHEYQEEKEQKYEKGQADSKASFTKFASLSKTIHLEQK